jgi:hypothetical protein
MKEEEKDAGLSRALSTPNLEKEGSLILTKSSVERSCFFKFCVK